MAEKGKVAVGENEQGVLSSDSSATIKLDLKGPPNGGLKAWIQVLGAFFLYFNTWGKFLVNPLSPRPRNESAPTYDRNRGGVKLWHLPEPLRGLSPG